MAVAYSEKETTFYSDGLALRSTVRTPHGATDSKPYPGLVVCHGYMGGKEGPNISMMAKRLSEAYVTVQLDYRGLNGSEGKRRLFPLEQAEDLRNAITFLSLQPGVDSKRLGLYGTSFAGAHVVYVSAIDKRIRCAVCLGGIADGEKWLRSLRREWEWREFRNRLEQDAKTRVVKGSGEMVHPLEVMLPDPVTDKNYRDGYKTNPDGADPIPLESAEKICAYKPAAVARNHGTPPILFGHGGADVLVPIDNALENYAAASEPKKLMILEGADHYDAYHSPDFDRFFAEALAWFKTYL